MNPLGSFWTKLAHGFPTAIIGDDVCQIGYEGSNGVSIQIKNLNKSFGSNHVLKNINLSIEPGETFSIIGPSGTGKSLLLRHIVKLIEADSGQVLINGHDINETKNINENSNFRYSMVFQSSALFNSLTVEENVGLWLREKRICGEVRIRRIIKENLERVGLAGKEELQTAELSGGMKKRVAIARSLAMNPDLILYDEPTAELDPVASDDLAHVIMSLKKKVSLTTIIVSHDLSFALYLSDRVAMMHGGEIIAIGTPEEIKESENPIVRNFIYTTTKGIQGEKE